MSANSALVCLILAMLFYTGICRTWRVWSNYAYFLSDQFDLRLRLTYTEASLYCQNLSSHLASVHSLEETEFLKSSTATDEASWFGLHHTQSSVPTDCNCGDGCPESEEPTSPECVNCVFCRGADKWQWEDGTEYDWTNWQSTQPSGYNNENQAELCVRFYGHGKWLDDVCSNEHYFICKVGTRCYPHYCTSNGICEENVCICYNGYTGDTCDTLITTTLMQTDKLTPTTSNMESKTPAVCNCHVSNSSYDSQSAALLSLGVVLAISVIANIALSAKVVSDHRNRHPERETNAEENTYYNNVVVQSNMGGTSHVSGDKNEENILVTKDLNSGDRQNAESADRQDTKDPYESLRATDINSSNTEMTTYAKLQ